MPTNSHTAQARTAIDRFLDARSIAVVGASTHPQKVGHQIVKNLLLANKANPHPRKIYPIHPTATSILGLAAYARLSSVFAPIEVVIIVVPVPVVSSIIDEMIEYNRHHAAAEKIKAVMIISAGFAETSKQGKALQHLLATKLKLANITLLGPNTLGLIAPHHFLNASFAQNHIFPGNLAVISQSGAMLTALFDALASHEVGVSLAVSLGNKADLSENECLEYVLHDPQTRGVILYLESFTFLPSFFELCAQLSKTKPVFLLKGGISEQGRRASASHTAALATNQVLLNAAADQMGFTLIENIEELVNLATFLSHHHQLPSNTMVITNAGGPGVNTIDELAKVGMPLGKWSSHSVESLSDVLSQTHPANPLDLLGDATPEHFEKALRVAQRDPQVDSLLIIVTPQAVTDMSGIVETLIQYKGKKPLFVSLIGGEHLERLRNKLREHHIFCTAFPNDSVQMLGVLYQVAEKQFRKERFMPSYLHNPAVPHTTTHRRLSQLRETPENLDLQTAFTVLKKQGFKVPEYFLITKQSLAQLNSLPYPLFAKTANLSLLHKKELGAIFGIVHNPTEAKHAYETLAKFGNQVLFQEIVEIDHELLLGIESDPQFGMFMTMGLGGSYTNILDDRAYVFLPTSRSRLSKTWQQTKAAQVFAKDEKLTENILDQLEKLQKLMMQHPWIKSLEINPLVINSAGVWVVDVKLSPHRV